MINCFVLQHPQSPDLIQPAMFNTKRVKCVRVACGTTPLGKADFSEANDFFPTYASWNSALFETSVILTIWEHADQLIGSNDVAIIHSDITLHFKAAETWKRIERWLRHKEKRAIGLTAPSSAINLWEDWEIPEDVNYIPKLDPMKLHSFDHNINVWDYIKLYDPDIYAWAMDTQPRLIYSHQFACTRATFDYLGNMLYMIAHRLRLQDIGFWTPHMFERLIALYLAKYGGKPVLSTCFWHMSSSGALGPGELSLYGPRPRRYYQLTTRWGNGQTAFSSSGDSSQS